MWGQSHSVISLILRNIALVGRTDLRAVDGRPAESGIRLLSEPGFRRLTVGRARGHERTGAPGHRTAMDRPSGPDQRVRQAIWRAGPGLPGYCCTRWGGTRCTVRQGTEPAAGAAACSSDADSETDEGGLGLGERDPSLRAEWRA